MGGGGGLEWEGLGFGKANVLIIGRNEKLVGRLSLDDERGFGDGQGFF